MSILSISSSSSSSSSNTSSKCAVHVHRRSSAPSIGNNITTSGIAASSSGSSSQLEGRVESLSFLSPPLINHSLSTVRSSSKFSSSSSSLVYSSGNSTPNTDHYPLPNDDNYTRPNHYTYTLYSSSTQTMPISTRSRSNFLELPPSKTRHRSNSVPVNPVLLHPISDDRTVSALKSSSSSGSSDVIRDIRIEPKENKHEGRRVSRSRDKTSFCFLNMRLAEEYIKTKEPEGYLQKAITLYRQVVYENRDTPPWVEPYFKLVDLLSETTDSTNNKEIISILNSVVEGNFDVWEKIDALTRKAQVFEKSHDYGDIDKVLDYWNQAKILVTGQTSAAEKIRKESYLKYLSLKISKMIKKKKAIDEYTSTI